MFVETGRKVGERLRGPHSLPGGGVPRGRGGAARDRLQRAHHRRAGAAGPR